MLLCFKETFFQFFFFLWTIWSKKYYQPVNLLQKPYKSIVHRSIPNKLTKQFPEINSSWNRLIRSHKLIVTVIKSYSPKWTPNIVSYRKYTNFDKDKFIDKISFNLTKRNLQELTLEAFIGMFKTVFEKHASLKKKCLIDSHSKYNRRVNTKNKEMFVYIY